MLLVNGRFSGGEVCRKSSFASEGLGVSAAGLAALGLEVTAAVLVTALVTAGLGVTAAVLVTAGLEVSVAGLEVSVVGFGALSS